MSADIYIIYMYILNIYVFIRIQSPPGYCRNNFIATRAM